MDDFRISDIKRGPQNKDKKTPAPPGSGKASPDVQDQSRQSEKTAQLTEEFNIRQYWETLLRYRFVVVLITVAVFAGTVGLTSLKPQMFRAEAVILRKAEPVGGLYSVSKGYRSDTLQKIATSRTVLQGAVHFIKDELKEFEAQGYEIPESDWQAAREMINMGAPSGSVESSIDRDSKDILYFVAVSRYSGFITAAIANSTARSFIDRLTEFERQEANNKSIILEKLYGAKQEEIDEIENKIVELRREYGEQEEGFTAIAADEQRLLNLASEYEMLYQTNKLNVEEMTEQIEALKRELGVEGVPSDQILWVDTRGNIMDEKLQELEMHKTELLTRYTPENSLVIRVQSQIEALRRSISQQREGTAEKRRVRVDSLRSDMVTSLILLESKFQGARITLESIKKTRNELNSKLIEFPVKTVELERLKRHKDILEKLSDDLRKDYQKETIASTAAVSDVQLIEPALPPSRPFEPNIRKAIILGICYGLGLGIAAAFLLHNWDNTINTTNEMKTMLHLPPLGLVPQWDENDKFINPAGFDELNAEVYGVLRNNIRYSKGDNPHKSLLITSAIQGEGKSLTAVNLACSFAFEGNRTLLLTVDLRRKREYYGLRLPGEVKKGEKGIAALLAGEAEYSQVIHRTTFDNLYLIPTGEKRKNANRLLVPDKLRRFFNDMERQFEVVIIDAPAVLPIVDTTLVSPFARGTLLVVNAGKTPVGAVQQAISRLEHVGTKMIGTTLNRAKNMKFDFFYGTTYTYYGGYKS